MTKDTKIPSAPKQDKTLTTPVLGNSPLSVAINNTLASFTTLKDMAININTVPVLDIPSQKENENQAMTIEDKNRLTEEIMEILDFDLIVQESVNEQVGLCISSNQQ